jgi:flagellar M-ring protein FliF
MSQQEAESIRNLVAAAVDDLHPGNVVLVDSAGRQVGRKSGDAEISAHEDQLAAKIVDTLEPVAGTGNIRASVNLEYDTGSADEVDENYDPNDVVTLSMQRSEQSDGSPPAASGIPGTASNAPNVQPPLYPKASANLRSEKQESGTYGASKKTRHTFQGPGRLRRLTAAILINQQKVTNGKQVSWRPRSAEEMNHLTELARAAVGFDSTRGDAVTLESLLFEDQTPSAQPLQERLLGMALVSQPLMKFGVILVAMLALLIFVVRPMMRKVQHAGATKALPAGAAAASAELPKPLPNAAQLELEQQRMQAQSVFESVTDHLRREPAQSTRLLQSWIHTE